jgi:asparagine synthase (glutamine-hydrolysing)
MVSPLLRAAHEHGVRVLLSGFDGDVTVSYGYEYLEELAQTGRWTDFAREAHALSQRFGGKPLSYLQHYGVQYLTELASQQRWWAFAKQAGEISAHFALSRQRLLLNAGLRPLLPQWLWRVRHRFRGPVQPPASMWGLNRAIHPAFAQRICLAERIQAFETTKSSSAHRLREQHLDSIMSGFMQYLGGMFDQIAATCALEQRYPFFDRRLVEFCLALPFEQKLRHGWTRAILRRAMEGFVPPTIQWRTDKGNLSLNIRRRLLAERETLDAVIWHDPSSIEAYVDVPVLRGAYHRYLSQLAATSEEDLFTIYLSVTLALWLRQSESFLAKNSWL